MLNISINEILVINGVAFGDILIEYVLVDDTYTLASLNIEFSENEGLSWNPCNPNAINPHHEVPVNLATSPLGVVHHFVWDSASQVTSNNIIVRIKSSTNNPSNTAITSSFVVDNIRTIAEVITPTAVQSDNSFITYKLYNNMSNLTDIECYYSKDGGDTWIEAKLGSGGDVVSNLTSSPNGESHIFSWDTSEIQIAELLFKVIPYDSTTGEIGYTGISESFFVDNHTEWFYKTVPYTFFVLDTDDVLRYYLKILDFERARQSNITTSMIELLDPLLCPARYVPYLAHAIGIDIDADAPLDIQRRQIASAVLWYKQKGTLSAFEAFFLTLGYKVEIHEITTDGTDSGEDFVGGNWYKTARLSITFLQYSDQAWIEPWDAERLLSKLDEIRPIHDLILEYNWGFDFTEIFYFDDDNSRSTVIDRPDLLSMDWLNQPVEIELFDNFFGDGVTVTFTNTISVPVGVDILPESVRIFAIGSGNEPMEGVDDGAGNITGKYIAAGSINYNTGLISVTFTIAPDNGAEVTIKYSLDKPYYHYNEETPHHIYNRRTTSLMIRDAALDFRVRLLDSSPTDKYGVQLPRDAYRLTPRVQVTNLNNNEVITEVTEKDGKFRNIKNQDCSEFWKFINLGVTVVSDTYNLTIPTPPNDNLPIVPATPMIVIDELEIVCDFEGNLSGGGTIGGLPYTVNSGSIDYADGSLTFTLSMTTPAGYDIDISYKSYEFIFKGDGATSNIPLSLKCLPITPGSIRIMHGGDVIARDNGLGGWEDGLAGSIDYTTGVGNVDIGVVTVLDEFYGTSYRFIPPVVDEDTSRYYRSNQISLGFGNGIATMFCAPQDAVASSTSQIVGQLLHPIPILPASFHFMCGNQWGRDDGLGNIVGSVGISGNIDYDTGAYSIVFTVAPLDTDELIVGWNCHYAQVNFESILDSTNDYDIQLTLQSIYANNNYDQANNFYYNRDALRLWTDNDFIRRSGYAEAIGIGDGVSTVFNRNLLHLPIQPGSVTILVWALNAAQFPIIPVNPVQIVAYDDGSGNIIGADNELAPIWGTIDYNTGVVTINFGAASCIPIAGANIVAHYSDTTMGSVAAIQELGWYHWKKKGSRLSILRAGVLYYNG